MGAIQHPTKGDSLASMPDPEKAVVVVQNLYGAKAGRWIAQGFVALVLLAVSAYCVRVIWENGGKALYESLSIPRVSLPTFDLQAAVLTVMVLMIFYSAILLGVLLFFVRRVFRRQIPQAALDELAEARSRAIHEILNAKVKSEEEFDKWKLTNNTWRTEVIEVLRKHFPKAEQLGFERLGVIPPIVMPNVYNNEHAHEMMMFIKRLGIVEDLIKRYAH
jgi:hypothetical protein